MTDVTATLPNVLFRTLRTPDDYPGMAEANQATRHSAGRPWPVSAAWLQSFFERFGTCDLARDVLAVERAGRIAGYTRVSWRDQVDGDRVVTSLFVLDPAERDRGIEQALLAWAEERMEALATELPDRPPTYRNTFTWADDVGFEALLAANGWTARARGYEMVRPDLDDVPDVPLPDGFDIRPIRDDAGRGGVWEAVVDAFADHRGQAQKTEADRQRFLEDDHQDPALWVIAFAGDEIAGGVLGVRDAEPAPDGTRRGLVDGVFTRAPFRRRGLARALVARSLALLREHGMTTAVLSVDGANPNQAMTLYESLGFEIAAVETDWIKPFPHATSTEDTR
jgi:ribosomal protein S18 acetylase RimI-like enzyme